MASTRRSAESPKKTDMKEHSMKEEQEHIGSERIKGSRGAFYSKRLHILTSHFSLTLKDLLRALPALSLLISLIKFQTRLPALCL